MRKLRVAMLVAAAAAFAGWVEAEGPSSLDADSLFGDIDPHEDGRTPLDPKSFDRSFKGPQNDPTGLDPFRSSAAQGKAVNTLFAGMRDMRDIINDFQLLDGMVDGKFDVDMSGQGGPDVPYSLCTADAECLRCYKGAQQSLDGMRLNLGRLRVAGKATSDLVARSLAFGDGLSGATGLAALEWQRQRTGINQEFETFKIKYFDPKYRGMMVGLKDALMKWDRCEAQFGEPDWYARFGFLYMTFMEDQYKRNF